MVPPEVQREPDLREYLQVLPRHKGLIALMTVVVVAVALVASFLQAPVYEGTAEVLLQPRLAESVFDGPLANQRLDPARIVRNEIRVLESPILKEEVRRRLGYSADISGRPAGETDVIQIVAEDGEPKRAAEIANTFAAAFIDLRRDQAVDDLLAAATGIQRKIDNLQGQIDAYDREIATAPTDEQSLVRQRVEPRREALVEQQSVFQQRLDQLQLEAELRTGGAQLVARSAVPESPIRPRPARNAALAMVGGLLLGMGLAFLVDHLDDTVNSKEELDRATSGVPVIGVIPAVDTWKRKDEPYVVTLNEPTSPAAEAYRTLRTSIDFLALDDRIGVLQLTSASAGEGKTTTLANLAVALARAGKRVAIVCCDLRRPRVHEFFGLSNSVGFTSVLLGEVPLLEALQKVPSVDRLSVLASGPTPPNPSELLSLSRTGQLLAGLRDAGYVVLVDSPPILPVTDGLVLSRKVDATLMVVAVGAATRKKVARAVELLQQVEAPVVGSVLNGISGDGFDGYAYEYYQYEPRGAKEKAAKKK